MLPGDEEVETFSNDDMFTTRKKIEHWMKVFKTQWNDIPPDGGLTEEQRVLLGNLLLEEAVEACHLGLGLDINIMTHRFGNDDDPDNQPIFDIGIEPGMEYDPIEFFDGLGDTVWVGYYAARIAGGNLDEVIDEIYDSNMSKLDINGEPITNHCTICHDFGHDSECQHALLDPTQPVGKILKGPNFRKPDIASRIFF